MTRGLMLLVGLIYLGAAIFAIVEKRWWWVVILVCYGVSQYALTKTMGSCAR